MDRLTCHPDHYHPSGARSRRGRRKILCLINPVSGPGRSKEIFDTRVEPVLLESGADVEVFVTGLTVRSFDLTPAARANHARDFVMHMDLNVYDCLVIVSGDGLYFEV